MKIPVLIYLAIVAAFLNGCKKFDGEILVENSCRPLKVPCAGCKGSSTLINTTTDKIITYTIKTTFIGAKRTFTTTKKIELYPGEEKDLGNNYDYGKQQQGSKCSETKSYEVRYEYEIVGQIVTKESK
jgi:hypothetical protein